MMGPLKFKDISQISSLHLEELHGFLSRMGEGFLTRFYEVSLDIPEMFTFVDKKKEQVLGFVSAAIRVKGLYKRVILKDVLSFAMLFLRYFFTHPQDIVKAAKTLAYPGFSDDIPELLTIAVGKNYRGRGVGRKLFVKTLEEFGKRGFKKFRVSVYDRMPANGFYKKMGCRFEKSFEFLGEKMNYYIYEP